MEAFFTEVRQRSGLTFVAFVSERFVFITRPFCGRRFLCLAFGLAAAGDDQPLSNGTILPHRSSMEQAGTLP